MTSLIESRKVEKDIRKAKRLKFLADGGNEVAKKEIEKVEEVKKTPIKKKGKKNANSK